MNDAVWMVLCVLAGYSLGFVHAYFGKKWK